jgi:hypothetical protein
MRKFILKPLLTLAILLTYGLFVNLYAQCTPIATLPVEEDFSGTFAPDCWTLDGGTNWVGVPTEHAGGTTPEAKFSWNPQTTGMQRFISPEINTSGYTSLTLSFKSFLDFYPNSENIFQIGVATSSDGTTWNTVYSVEPTEDIGPEVIEIEIDNADMGSGTFQFAFFFNGNSFDISNWYIDDVLLRELNSGNDILTFTLDDELEPAVINNGAKTVTLEVVNGTSLTALTPDFTLSESAKAYIDGTLQTSGTSTVDFSAPVTYSVSAEDGTVALWTVTVTEADLYDGTDFIEFSFDEQTGDATINSTAHTIDIEVNWQADLADLVADFTLSHGADASIGATAQVSGVTSNDFSTSETTPIVYTVTAEDGTTVQNWEVSVTQETTPEGIDCDNPLTITLPADLPFSKIGHATCGMGDAYMNTALGNYDSGEDVIYEITVTSDVAIKVTMDPKTTTYGGIGIFDACPDTGNLVESVTGSAASPKVIESVVLTAGTYYLMVDTWASPYCIPEYDLTIEEACPPPTDLEITGISDTEASIGWTAGLNETSWNLKVSTTELTDPDTEAGDVYDGTINTTPEHDLSSLTEETDYYVYVQADCGSEWVDDMFTTLSSCPPPTDIEANSITETAATLTWTAGLSETDWNLKVSSTVLDDPDTDAGDVFDGNINTTPEKALSSLNPATTYYVYVQADCGSDWAEYDFNTLCGIIASFPYFEGFEGENMPACWTVLNEDGDSKEWEINTTYAYEGNQSTGVGYNWDGNDDWLISPQFDITSDEMFIEFYARATSDTYYEDFEVLISKASTATIDFTITVSSEEQIPNEWGVFQYSLADAGVSSGDDIYVAIRCISDNELRLVVDNFSIRETNTETDILTFSFPEQTGPATIDAINHEVEIEVAYGTDLSELIADFTLSVGATAAIGGTDQESGVTENDFSTSETTPVVYTITAEDGTTVQDWEVTVTEAPVNTETDFLTYSLPGETAPATITPASHTIDVNIGWTVEIDALIADFTLSHGATAEANGVEQISGTTVNDFTSPVTYTVTAEDESTQQAWTVTVTQDPAPLGTVCGNPFTLTLPADLPYEHLSQTTCGAGNVYSNTEMGTYDNGEETVYEITITEDVAITIELDSYLTTSSSIGLFSSCPSQDEIIEYDGSYDANQAIEDLFLTAGTYYLVVDRPSTDGCIDEYDLTITTGCPAPNNIEIDMTPTTNTLTWSAGGIETDWNVKVSEGSSINPETDYAEFFEGLVNTTPEQELIHLTSETTYYVYIQSDCGSDWTSYTFTTPNACPVPTDLEATAVATDYAELTWEDYGEAQWILKVSTTSIDPETEDGDIVVAETTTDNPYSLSGLDPNTGYYFYVQSSPCESDWSDEGYFMTDCETITSFPYTENFDGDWDTWCWRIIDNDDDGTTWEQDDEYITPHSGDWTAHGMGNNDDYLITPQLSINSDKLIMEWWDVVEGSSYNNTYDILVSTTNKDIASFTDNLGTFDCTNTTWTKHNVDLSAYDGQNIFIAFHQTYSDATYWGFGIDDVTIREISSETDFLTYSFPENFEPSDIDAVNHTIDVIVGNGTDLSELTANFTLSEGASAEISGVEQVSGVTENDFTSAVTYTVTAEDGVTTQAWVVTVTEAPINTDTDFLTYTFPEEATPAVIDLVNHTVDIEVHFLADLSALTAEFTMSYGAVATIDGTEQVSGVTENDFSSPVTYSITAEDGVTEQAWIVTATHADVPEGANCDNPHVITLPADLPYEATEQTNCGLGDLYDETEMDYYDGGEDAIYEMVITEAVAINITLNPNSSTYSGIGLFDGCPSTDNMIDYSSNSSTGTHGLEEIVLQPGTYYIMVDTWPSPDCIPDYDLTIETACPDVSEFFEDLTPTTAIISWTPGGVETEWNVMVSSTDIDPTSETGDLFDDVVTTTPEVSVSSLTAETEYFVYVQTACGTEWAEYSFTTPEACPKPANLTADAISTDFAELSWSAYGETEWYIKVSSISINPETEDGDIIANELTTDNPYTVNGLEAGNTYYAYVQSSCGSDWSDEYEFETAICPISEQCEWRFELEDSYGDGWNGASFSIIQGGTTIGSATMTSGSSATINQTICTGMELQIKWVSGSFDYEASFSIYDAMDNEIFTYSGSSADDGTIIFSTYTYCSDNYDIALAEIPSGFSCETLDSPIQPLVEFENVGLATIPSGAVITFTLDSDGTNILTENISLLDDFEPGDVYSSTTTNTADFTTVGTYLWEATITYAQDVNPMNDMVDGYTVHFDQTVNFVDAVNDTITIESSEYPYTIQTDVSFVPDSASLVPEFIWAGGETTSTLEVTESGWYYVTVTTLDCVQEDSVFVLDYNNVISQNGNQFAVYPNPSTGLFNLELNLTEKQDVTITIYSSNGAIIRNYQFDNTDNFSRKIDLNDVAEGLYLLRIQLADESLNQQLIVR